jgi:hypothetical protein
MKRQPQAYASVFELSIVDQVRMCAMKKNAVATKLGWAIGLVITGLTYCTAHFDAPNPGREGMYLLVAGGVLFSCLSVQAWMQKAFKGYWKAWGIVLLLEGTMVFGNVWAGVVAMIFLAFINATACGCLLALDGKKVKV